MGKNLLNPVWIILCYATKKWRQKGIIKPTTLIKKSHNAIKKKAHRVHCSDSVGKKISSEIAKTRNEQ